MFVIQQPTYYQQQRQQISQWSAERDDGSRKKSKVDDVGGKRGGSLCYLQ